MFVNPSISKSAMSTTAIVVVVQFSGHLVSCGKQPIKREDKFLISQFSCNDS